MAWLLLLVVFWKPIWYSGKLLYNKIKKIDDPTPLNKLKAWGSAWLELVKP